MIVACALDWLNESIEADAAPSEVQTESAEMMLPHVLRWRGLMFGQELEAMATDPIAVRDMGYAACHVPLVCTSYDLPIGGSVALAGLAIEKMVRPKAFKHVHACHTGQFLWLVVLTVVLCAQSA